MLAFRDVFIHILLIPNLSEAAPKLGQREEIICLHRCFPRKRPICRET